MWIKCFSFLCAFVMYANTKLPDDAVRCYGVVSRLDAYNQWELFNETPCDPEAYIWLLQSDCAQLLRGYNKPSVPQFGCVYHPGDQYFECKSVDRCAVNPESLREAKNKMAEASMQKEKSKKPNKIAETRDAFSPRIGKRRRIAYASEASKNSEEDL